MFQRQPSNAVSVSILSVLENSTASNLLKNCGKYLIFAEFVDTRCACLFVQIYYILSFNNFHKEKYLNIL